MDYTECRECGVELDTPVGDPDEAWCGKHRDDTIEAYDVRGDR